MKLITINKWLRKIGLVLTLYTGMDIDGDRYHAFTLERKSRYDARVKRAKNDTEAAK